MKVLRQPPCEAVSWNKNWLGSVFQTDCQPPCEAVSWNVSGLSCRWLNLGQPPCEAVSWNQNDFWTVKVFQPSASLWGCELKYSIKNGITRKASVSLLVRLWVEMHCPIVGVWVMSSQPPCEAVSWNTNILSTNVMAPSQPPCEAVSWNKEDTMSITNVAMSASLWGCELKFFVFKPYHWNIRQPPCEAVSWNISIRKRRYTGCRQPPCEAVSWNSDTDKHSQLWYCQPPCEAVSWNSLKYSESECLNRQPPCEAVSWNNSVVSGISGALVSLLVRLWVEIYPNAVATSFPTSASLWGCELKWRVQRKSSGS